MFKSFAVFLGFMISLSISRSQEIEVNCINQPLNQTLINLRDNYQLQISFNDHQLSKYLISVDKTFESFESVLEYLLLDIPFSYENQNEVFIIIPNKKKLIDQSSIIAGQVIDMYNSEGLPFTHLVINGSGLITDFKGNFSYTSSTDSIFRVQASYLGYYILDTTISEGIGKLFKLIPSSFKLKEITIEGKTIERSIQSGASPGEIRLNHKLANTLPGNGDNSVFNLLRLQPGVLAAGEQSSDIVIWGSYEGQSQVLFDGYKVFGLKNFNDNISAVNPYLVKDIQVLKGGYGVEYADRVGGIVNITGIDGNKQSPTVNLCLNNLTLNAKASIPVFKKGSLIIAYRQTYFNLYDSLNIPTIFNRRQRTRPNTINDITVYPAYDFSDMNIKYSGKSKNGDSYYLSMFRGNDRFNYNVDESIEYYVLNNYDEKNEQYGIAAFYGRLLENGMLTNFSLNYSGIETTTFDEQFVRNINNNRVLTSRNHHSYTSINEINSRMDNAFSLKGKHDIRTGVGLTNSYIELQEDTFDVRVSEQDTDMQVLSAYVKDNIIINEAFNLNIGLRTDYPIDLKLSYFQPRISATYRFNKYLKMNTSWGLYNQFVTKGPVSDSLGNYNYYWVACNNDDIPVLESKHFVLGFSSLKNGLLFNIEAYSKNTTGIIEFFQTQFTDKELYQGDSKSRGIDIFIKKDYKGHSAWISYSLSKTEERFPITRRPGQQRFIPTNRSIYIPALHDQRHEVKFAGLLEFDPFYFSANYVYGSGFPERRNLFNPVTIYGKPYSRFDISVIYRFLTNKSNLEAGLSVLNVFNTENIKYSDFVPIPENKYNSISINSEAIPFTPTLFLNISF